MKHFLTPYISKDLITSAEEKDQSEKFKLIQKMVEALGGDFCQLLENPTKSWMTGSILFLPYEVEVQLDRRLEKEISQYLGVHIKYVSGPMSV